MRLTLFFCLVSIICFGQNFSQSEQNLQQAFLTAEKGDTIDIPKGQHKILRSLWLDDSESVVIRGAGMEESILDFSDQIDGAEGIKITNSAKITIMDLSVREVKGDAIKIQDTQDITLRRVRTEWLGKPDKKNGAYGIYPVLCKYVLIEDSEAIGASDAGIYVGQSEDIIVRNNLAYNNVAGIEIENSERADVYNNNAYGNAGGILVFDLPDLQKKKGGKIRIFDNIIAENNLKNFAPKGNIVAKVPQGTGILILATSDVEAFGNKILDNRSMGVGIISYYLTELPISDDQYDPFPHRINIHDNQFTRRDIRATSKGRFGKIFKYKLKFGKKVPHILWDGITNDNTNPQICIRDNSEQTFANIDAENDFENISKDDSEHSCEPQRLDQIKIDP